MVWGRLRRPSWLCDTAGEQDAGDASVPTPRLIHPRPYGYEYASRASRFGEGDREVFDSIYQVTARRFERYAG